MSNSKDEIAQILEEARRGYETLSVIVSRYPKDWDDVLGYLDFMLGQIPEPLRPVGLLDLRKTIEAKKSQAEEANASENSVDWNYLMGLATGQEVASPEIILPDSVREGTYLAKVYRAIAEGTTTTSDLNKKFPDYAIKHILFNLKRKGAIQPVGRGRWKTKAQDAAPEQVSPQEIALPAGIEDGTPYATVCYAIMRREKIPKELYWAVQPLKKKGVVEGDGRTKEGLKIKKQPATIVSGATGKDTSGQKVGRSGRRKDYIQPGSITDSLLVYVNSIKGEETYDDIGLHFPDVRRDTLYATLDRLKRKGFIAGGSRTAKKKDYDAGAQHPVLIGTSPLAEGSPETAYADDGHGSSSAAAEVISPPASLTDGPTKPVVVMPSPDAAPPPLSVNSVLQYLAGLSERLPETQVVRLERYVLQISEGSVSNVLGQYVLPVPPDKASELIAALNGIGEALERRLNEDGDIDRFLGGLEQAGTRVADIAGYLDSLRAGAGQETAALPADGLGNRISGNGISGEEKAPVTAISSDTYRDRLTSYYSLQPELDNKLSIFETSIQELPDEQLARFYRIALKILPEDREDAGLEHTATFERLSEAIRMSSKNDEGPEKLLKYFEGFEEDHIEAEDVEGYLEELKSQRTVQPRPPVYTADSSKNGWDIDPAKVPQYSDDFPHPPANAVPKPTDVRTNNAMDLSQDIYWGHRLSHGSQVGIWLRESVPHIYGHNAQLGHAIQTFMGNKPIDVSLDTWKAFEISQMDKAIRRVEEKGSVPQEVYGAYLTILRLPNPQTYLQRFSRALIGRNGYLTTDQWVELASRINGAGERGINTAIGRYKKPV